MSDIEFLSDSLDGAEFALRVTLDHLPSEMALVSFFTLDTREFVAVRAAGASATPEIVTSVLMKRSPEKGPISHRAMRSNQTVVLDESSADGLKQDPRWIATGVAPQSVMCAPVQLGGRYLGLIEIANPLDGEPFTTADGNALTYIGQQLAEFLGQRDTTVDEQRVRAPKLSARMKR
jgi:GAF domain-containing protein